MAHLWDLHLSIRRSCSPRFDLLLQKAKLIFVASSSTFFLVKHKRYSKEETISNRSILKEKLTRQFLLPVSIFPKSTRINCICFAESTLLVDILIFKSRRTLKFITSMKTEGQACNHPITVVAILNLLCTVQYTLCNLSPK